MKRKILLAAGLGLIVLMGTSCTTWLDAEQQKNMIEGYGRMLERGVITRAQHDALVSAAQGTREWLLPAVEVALAVAGSLFGVRLWRGPITARKGATPPPATPAAA